MKLSPKKCSFFMRKVKNIEYIVSAEGVEADPDKIYKVKNWPITTNPEQVRSFLGFVGYRMGKSNLLSLSSKMHLTAIILQGQNEHAVCSHFQLIQKKGLNAGKYIFNILNLKIN